MTFLSVRARQSPDLPALIFDGGQWTYAELNRRVDALAADLLQRGLHPGDRLSAALENTPASVTLIHAALRLGLTLVPLNLRLTEAERAWQRQAAGWNADFEADGKLRPQIEKRIFESDGARLETDCPATLIFTSGTTGQPKGALLTLENHRAAAQASSQRLGTREGERWLLCLPLYHIGGMSILFRACWDGMTAVLQKRFEPRETYRWLSQHSVSLISLVPTLLYRLLPFFQSGGAPVSLRLILLGGASADPARLQQAFGLHLPLATTYGLSEACAQVATALPDLAARKPGCAGAPMPGLSVRVVDEAGSSLPPGQVGEITVSGPTVMRGYLHQPPLTGELHTGDIGCLDEDGDLWVLTRRSDLILSGGENIYPEEVERALSAHPAVGAACVFGLPDPEWGQRVAAAVVPRAEVSASELLSFLRLRLAGYKLPRQIYFVDDLPYTASGKLQRAEAARRFHLAASSDVETDNSAL